MMALFFFVISRGEGIGGCLRERHDGQRRIPVLQSLVGSNERRERRGMIKHVVGQILGDTDIDTELRVCWAYFLPGLVTGLILSR